ncbi:sterol 3-beta-glucosyltransferase [Acrasis kona]|uniref:Sterol 3-beta-glucosyltransferase n=1 Tax=Acrasis kona TaxID=1008807 RepID=A0AAW2Z2J5_9EUKA
MIDSSFRSLGVSTKDNVAKTGYLVKRGQNYKTWKKRWFRLHSEGILSYHKDAIDVYHPLGLIYLSEAFIENHDPFEKMDNILVVRVDGKRYMLSAESPEERESWMKALQNVIKRNSAQTSTKPESATARDLAQTKQMVERLLELMSVMEDGLGNTMTHSEESEEDDEGDDTSSSDDEGGSPSSRGRSFSLSTIKQHKREHICDPAQRFMMIINDVENIRSDMKAILQHVTNANNNAAHTEANSDKNQSDDSTTLIQMNHDLKEQLDKANAQIEAYETKIDEQNIHKNVLIKEVKNLRLQVERLKVKEQ